MFNKIGITLKLNYFKLLSYLQGFATVGNHIVLKPKGISIWVLRIKNDLIKFWLNIKLKLQVNNKIYCFHNVDATNL